MNTADLAIIAITVTGLANVWVTYRLHMRALDKVGDRVRVVNPVKAPAPEAEAANVAELEKRRLA